MLPFLTNRILGRTPQDSSAPTVEVAAEPVVLFELDEAMETTMLRTIGWISAGLGAVAIGLFVGRELRQRYKFNRRTPYDFYAHSGDEGEMEFGVGI